jgi:regulator of protease activity HflC (stomatin/prohibitin superfamily)
MMLEYLSYLLLVVVVVMFLSAAIRILREYERGVVFTLVARFNQFART